MSSAKYKLSLWLGNTYHDTVVINWLLSFCHMSLFTTVTTKRAEPGIAPAEHTYSAFYSLSYFNRCSDLCRFRLLLRLCNSLKLFHSFFTKEYEKQNQLIRYYEAILQKPSLNTILHTHLLSPPQKYSLLQTDCSWLMPVNKIHHPTA